MHGLSVVGKGNKHGYADKDGKLVVPLVYDEAIAFSEAHGCCKTKWQMGISGHYG